MKTVAYILALMAAGCYILALLNMGSTMGEVYSDAGVAVLLFDILLVAFLILNKIENEEKRK